MDIIGYIAAEENFFPISIEEIRRMRDNLWNGERLVLRNRNLSGLDFSEENNRNLLTEADLTGANLTNTVLTGAHLERAVLRGVNLTNTDLTGAHLERAVLIGAHLDYATLTKAHLTGADLAGADLTNTTLKGAILIRSILTGAHLERADLTRAHLTGADLTKAYLTEAYLEGAHLERAYLEGACLDYTTLTRAHLEGAHLEGADLTRAYLTRANLTGAHLTGASLRRSILSDIEFDINTVFHKAIFDTNTKLDENFFIKLKETGSDKSNIYFVVPDAEVEYNFSRDDNLIKQYKENKSIVTLEELSPCENIEDIKKKLQEFARKRQEKLAKARALKNENPFTSDDIYRLSINDCLPHSSITRTIPDNIINNNNNNYNYNINSLNSNSNINNNNYNYNINNNNNNNNDNNDNNNNNINIIEVPSQNDNTNINAITSTISTSAQTGTSLNIIQRTLQKNTNKFKPAASQSKISPTPEDQEYNGRQ